MMKRNDAIIAVLIGLSVLFVFVVFTLTIMGLFTGRTLTFGSLGRRIALVEIHGVMTEAESTVRQLKHYARDESIPAIVLRINTPGGTAAVAQEIYEQIDKVRQDGKKVVASMGPLAASGGYYVACAADTIVANPATLTGSIGVQMQLPRTDELFRKIGVEFRVVKSGPHKDIGSPHRPMTEEERRILQGVIDDSYEQFVDVIVAGRELPREEVLAVADGRIFTGRQAHELGLVDEIGTYEEAIIMAARMVGIEGEPRVIRERRRREDLFDILFQLAGRLGGSVQKQAALEYLLSP
jgi:protease-4